MTARVEVRPCRSPADVAAIEVSMPSGPSQFHRRRFEHAGGSVYLLAWLGGAAVGHVLVTRTSKYDEVCRTLGRFPEVNALGVADAHRRCGVATALMRAAAEEARRMGGGRLGLAVEPDNAPATRLYESLGFERDPVLEVVDVWAWLDDGGGEHEERSPCHYWTRDVSAVAAGQEWPDRA
jgi:GNAT superfamily N-acetyltransferase